MIFSIHLFWLHLQFIGLFHIENNTFIVMVISGGVKYLTRCFKTNRKIWEVQSSQIFQVTKKLHKIIMVYSWNCSYRESPAAIDFISVWLILTHNAYGYTKRPTTTYSCHITLYSFIAFQLFLVTFHYALCLFSHLNINSLSCILCYFRNNFCIL